MRSTLQSEKTQFQDRQQAGRLLAELLESYCHENPVVLAIPRGGVPVGYEIAKALDAPLDVIVARKLGAPGQPELGIGAIAPGGILILNGMSVRYRGIDAQQIDRIMAKEQREMQRRERLYRGDYPPVDVHGRTVIITDDGLATGVTARAAIQSVRQQDPARIILAVPVCSPETPSEFHPIVDDIVCLKTPHALYAVGLWYRNFDQVTDRNVLTLMAAARPPQREAGKP